MGSSWEPLLQWAPEINEASNVPRHKLLLPDSGPAIRRGKNVQGKTSVLASCFAVLLPGLLTELRRT